MKSLEKNKVILETALKQIATNIFQEDIVAAVDEAVANSKSKIDDMALATFREDVIAKVTAVIQGAKL